MSPDVVSLDLQRKLNYKYTAHRYCWRLLLCFAVVSHLLINIEVNYVQVEPIGLL
jgi:hypothetical protein